MRQRCSRMAAAAAVVGLLASSVAEAKVALRRARFFSRGSSNVSLRKRLNINGIIASPGTFELDFGGLYSYTNAFTALPSSLKFTPEGSSLFIGRTEYSVSFDAVDADASTATHFSDRITVAATSVIFDSEHFDIAIAPQVTTLLRNDRGVRVGGTALARYQNGGSNFGLSASWTGASTASPTNPAGLWDLGAGCGQQLAKDGFLGKVTPHVNAVWERATGFTRTIAVFGGIEFQLHPRLAFDLSAQRVALVGEGPDRQVLAGITWTLGRLQP